VIQPSSWARDIREAAEGAPPTVGIQPAPELSIVIPTYNERGNIPIVVDRLRASLAGIAWELIVVDDDSPDGTAALVKEIGATDGRVRCIRRLGRRGLSGACLEGMLASQGDFAAVMDGDLQHDEGLLRPMLDLLRRDAANLVVATRYAEGATAHGLSSQRTRSSRIATNIALRVLNLRLSDPMSGFFMLRRAIVDRFAEKLSTQGFKILLDIAITAHDDLRIAELPYVFRPRHHGESKFDAGTALEYLGLILAKASHDLISLRFVLFCFVGATGIAVHFAVLAGALYSISLDFIWAQIAATMAAIASNFAINNALTYRDRRLKGCAYLGGMLGFYVISLVGIVSNIGVADWLFNNAQKWWIAGLAGAIIGVVWNYVVASLLIWRTR
jgi:dolichol-phosphate mannosyltransferase